MTDRLDEGLKTFLLWQGIAHIVMAGYAGIAGYVVLSAYQLGDKLTTQQTFMVSTIVGVLPVMLNWYMGVMASLLAAMKREAP